MTRIFIHLEAEDSKVLLHDSEVSKLKQTELETKLDKAKKALNAVLEKGGSIQNVATAEAPGAEEVLFFEAVRGDNAGTDVGNGWVRMQVLGLHFIVLRMPAPASEMLREVMNLLTSAAQSSWCGVRVAWQIPSSQRHQSVAHLQS